MNINISNANGEAIYMQIVNQIKTLILEGQMKEGEMLPSMRNLAVELHISLVMQMQTVKLIPQMHHLFLLNTQ